MLFNLFLIYCSIQTRKYSTLSPIERENLRVFAYKKIMNTPKYSIFKSCFKKSREPPVTINNDVHKLLVHFENPDIILHEVFRKSGAKEKVETLYGLLVNYHKFDLNKFEDEEISSALKKYIQNHLGGIFPAEIIAQLIKYSNDKILENFIKYTPFVLDDERYNLFRNIVSIVKSRVDSSKIVSFNVVFGLSLMPALDFNHQDGATNVLLISMALLLLDIEDVPAEFFLIK